MYALISPARPPTPQIGPKWARRAPGPCALSLVFAVAGFHHRKPTLGGQTSLGVGPNIWGPRYVLELDGMGRRHLPWPVAPLEREREAEKYDGSFPSVRVVVNTVGV